VTATSEYASSEGSTSPMSAVADPPMSPPLSAPPPPVSPPLGQPVAQQPTAQQAITQQAAAQQSDPWGSWYKQQSPAELPPPSGPPAELPPPPQATQRQNPPPQWPNATMNFQSKTADPYATSVDSFTPAAQPYGAPGDGQYSAPTDPFAASAGA